MAATSGTYRPTVDPTTPVPIDPGDPTGATLEEAEIAAVEIGEAGANGPGTEPGRMAGRAPRAVIIAGNTIAVISTAVAAVTVEVDDATVQNTPGAEPIPVDRTGERRTRAETLRNGAGERTPAIRAPGRTGRVPAAERKVSEPGNAAPRATSTADRGIEAPIVTRSNAGPVGPTLLETAPGTTVVAGGVAANAIEGASEANGGNALEANPEIAVSANTAGAIRTDALAEAIGPRGIEATTTTSRIDRIPSATTTIGTAT